MKKKLLILASGGMILSILVLLLVSGPGSAVSTTPATRVYNDPHVCSMHPHVATEGPGECSKCSMSTSRLDGHEPGTVLPPVSKMFTSPDNPLYVHEGPGKDPQTGTTLIPITDSPIYEPRAVDEQEHTSDTYHSQAQKKPAETKQDIHPRDSGKSEPGTDADSELYTCGMHPDVIQDGPGNCPICGMDLTPLRSPKRKSGSSERAIAYWVAPMDPNYISDKPGKSPMGMDLVPVYEDELSTGLVRIDPVTVQNIGVVTTRAEIRDLQAELRTNGIVAIAEDAEYRINPKISGWIEKLYVTRTGDLVEAGARLMDIYSPELVSAQEEYLLALENARRLETSRINRVRTGADELLAAAKRRLELWDINPSQIDKLRETGEVQRTLTMYSPVYGHVWHKNAVEGAAFKAGTDLFRIVDLRSVWIDAQVFEYELPWISEGDQAIVHSPYNPGISIQGTVDYIYPFLDTATRTARIRLVIPNPELELRPDMYVDVRIKTRVEHDVVTVPKNAVIRSGERDIVFVELGEGRYMPREVRIGLESGSYFEITSGVSPGTPVVTSAQFLLDSEAKLQETVQRRLQSRSKNDSDISR